MLRNLLRKHYSISAEYADASSSESSSLGLLILSFMSQPSVNGPVFTCSVGTLFGNCEISDCQQT